ncbi:phage tail protein [Clostridium botulinum]|nr:phage tail protein [Clostridium botulinum]
MIKLFAPNTIDFKTNGETVLTNVMDPEITEELNGNYALSFKYPIEEPKVVKGTIQANTNVITNKTTIVGTKGNINLQPKSYFLQKDYIVYANNQAFRIYNVKRDMSMININCRHIFYDLLDNFLEDVRPTKLNRLDALRWILERTQYTHKFTATGNLGGTNTRNFIRKNVVEAIMGKEGIIETWGGEIVRDNFNIGLWDNRGNDRGVLIQGGKNLIGIEEDLDTDNVITRIMPTGLDENDTIIMLPEKYIDSANINMYPHPKVRHMHYGDIKVNKETNITKDDVIRLLRLKVKELYEVEKVDIPEINYKVDFIELSKTEEYKDYITLEKVEVGDTVTVRYNKLNLDIKAKVIKTTKTFKGDKWVNEKVELGNFKRDVTSSLNKIDSITTDDGKVKGEAIWGTIDATKASLKAMADSADTQVERAIIFEDKDPDSPTYGAMCLGTRGFQIAREMTNGQWQWTTFGTGQGFTADLIRAGILQSLDGTLRIDLGGGSFKTYNYDKYPAIELKNMNIDFYDFKKSGKKAGTIYTSYAKNEPDKLGFSTGHYRDYYMSIVHHSGETDMYYPYLRFDKYHNRSDTHDPITFYEHIDATWSPLKYYKNNQQIGIVGANGEDLKIGFMGDNNTVRFGRQWSSEFETNFTCADWRKNTNKVGFIAYKGAEIQGKTLVFGDFSVTGKKNCIVQTKDYGERLINAYETLGYYFGDLGYGFVSEDGIAYIEIEDMVTQIMNTDIPYHVTYTEIVPEMITDEEIRQRSPLRLVKTTPTYFVLKGEPGAQFTWELKAKRIGYENVRADSPHQDELSRVINDHVEIHKGEEIDLENRLLIPDKLEDILLQ